MDEKTNFYASMIGKIGERLDADHLSTTEVADLSAALLSLERCRTESHDRKMDRERAGRPLSRH